MPERLDANAVRRWCRAGLDALRRHRDELDDLNVYPVPDGDTGTNLLLTMTAAAEAVESVDAGAGGDGADGDGADEGVDVVLLRLARGALLGARGNSGVILAQLLRGMADALAGVRVADGHALAKAIDRAASSAYQAVATPVEGTVLTVAAAAATAAREAGSAIASVVASAAAAAARVALAHTPEQLPDLARAGVPDAGGAGLAVLLDALVEALAGEALPPLLGGWYRGRGVPGTVARETGSSEYAYEVQYLLEASPAAMETARAALERLGDSLVVVGTGGAPDRQQTWNVHVHVNDIGAAIEAGVEAGRPHRISVTRFADQTAPGSTAPDCAVPDRVVPGAAPGDPSADELPASQVVVVCPGAGLAALFAAEGASVVRVDHGPPSPEEILACVMETGANQVVVLPGDPAATAAATRAVAGARAVGVHATVVPARAAVQALAALAVRTPGRRFEDDVIAMAEAAGACRHAALAVAGAEALTVVGRCRPGDVLALVDGEVNLIGSDVTEVGRQLLDRMLAAGGELVTLVTGAEAPPDLAEALRSYLRVHWPFVETQAFDGGQPGCPLMVGVE